MNCSNARNGPSSRQAGWVRAALIASTACTVLLSACSRESDDRSAPPLTKGQAAPVTIATVTRRDVPIEIRNFGTVEAYSTVAVKTQVSGGLMQVHFKEGQRVKSGDMLFTIDPRPFEASVKQLQANLAKDTFQAKNAKRQADHSADLLKKGAATQDEYENTKTIADAMEATVAADNAALENARIQLSYCFIRSPVDGAAGRLLINQGSIVKENDLPLVVLNQVKPIYAAFTVPQQHLPDIRRRMAQSPLEATASIPGENETYRGTLTFIDNTVDATTGTIRLKATFGNEQVQLWPGQFVNVVLILSTQKDAVVVPSRAIQTGQQGPHVFVVRPDKTVEVRPVAVGWDLDSDSVIKEGLEKGEIVVTDGQLRLGPGTSVEIRPEPSGGAARGAPKAGAGTAAEAGATTRPPASSTAPARR